MILTDRSEYIFQQQSQTATLTTVCFIWHNSSHAFITTISSVLAQTVDALDLILIERGTHNEALLTALEWLEKNASQFNRILVIRQPDSCLAAAFNLSVQLAETPYVLFLAAESQLYPRFIERCQNALITNPKAAIAYCITEQIGVEAKLIGNVPWSEAFTDSNQDTNPIFLVGKQHFIQASDLLVLQATDCQNNVEIESLLWHQLAKIGMHGVLVPEILARRQLLKVFYPHPQENTHSSGIAGIVGTTGNYIIGWLSAEAKRSLARTTEDYIKLYINEQATEAQIIRRQRPTVEARSLPADIPKEVVWFELQIPDTYLDGYFHKIVILDSDDEPLCSPIQYRFKLNGHLDILTHCRVAGWITDPASSIPIEIDIYVNDEKQKSVTANLVREDVKSISSNFSCGFETTFSSQSYACQTVQITLKNSAHALFDTPKVQLSSSGTIEALYKTAQAVSFDEQSFDAVEKQWILESLMPEIIAQFRAATRSGGQTLFACLPAQLLKLGKSSPVIADTVDVIIPVYKNLEVTRRCIEQALTAKGHTPYNILVIDDCGPEPEVRTYLKELSAKQEIELVVNEENKGFVYSVNHGMRCHGDRDVVLLNSDAIVQDYWLDRLRSAAYSSKNIASATPLSNHASIFSYPKICHEVETLPEDITASQLSHTCFELNKEKVVDVPTMHGFCCFVKRKALSKVGLFDLEKWVKGTEKK